MAGNNIGNDILRTNQFDPLEVQVFCEEKNGLCLIQVFVLECNATSCPVIKERSSPFSEHPMMRPFDKFLEDGDPHIGRVIHVFICTHEDLQRILCSIVITAKKILILPAWGTGAMKPLKKRDSEVSPVAHITIEENVQGEVTIHYTGPIARGERKKKYYPKAKLNLGNEYGLHIGTLGINEYTDLDPLGIVYRYLTNDELPRSSIEEVEQILKGSLNPYHPLLKLPPEFEWDDNHHLETQFILVGNRLDNVRYPLNEIIPSEKDSVEQLNRIKIGEKRSLLIKFNICSGKLNNDFQWKESKM